MRSIINAVIIILLSFILISCTHYRYYTTGTRDYYSLTDEDIKKLQFYNSQPFQLTREVSTLDSKKVAKGHTLRSEQGKLIEEVSFDALIPGVAINSTYDQLDISFEEGKTLPFNVLYDNSTYYCLKLEKDNSVLYDGVIYKVDYYYYYSYNSNPCLFIIAEDLYKVEQKTRHAEGIRLKEN